MIEQKLFVEALRFVAHCAAAKDIRYYLNGVHFELSPSRLTMVATDGHRMAMAEIAGSFGNASSVVTVKGADIKTLLAVVKPVTGEVSLLVAGDTFSLNAVGSPDLLFAGIDGKFPDWRRVMPGGEPEATAAFGVNAVYFAEAAKSCDRLSGKYSGMKMELRGASNAVWITPDVLPAFTDAGLERIGVMVSPMRL